MNAGGRRQDGEWFLGGQEGSPRADDAAGLSPGARTDVLSEADPHEADGWGHDAGDEPGDGLPEDGLLEEDLSEDGLLEDDSEGEFGDELIDDDLGDDELADDEEDFADRFGSGIEDRDDEGKTSRRTLWLALLGLGLGLAAVLTLLVVLLPEPATVRDVRPDLRSRAEAARSDLVDVHEQQLTDLLTDAPTDPRPDVSVVCDIVPGGDGPRQQRCELRATSLVTLEQMARPDDVPAAACGMRELNLADFPPLVARVSQEGCGGPAPFLWFQGAGGAMSETYAGWSLQKGAGQGGGERVAVVTRHDLGTFDIGTCPEGGCGWEQVQLPNVDFHTGDEKR